MVVTETGAIGNDALSVATAQSRPLAPEPLACNQTAMETQDRSRRWVTNRPKISLSPAGAVVLVGTLGTAYMAGQFLRNSVGVIAPDLAAELELSASQIGLLASVFFFSFAAVQLPLGMALDRYGPKRCMLVCAMITIAGSVLFATAQTASTLTFARALMGIGTSCYLMAPLALYARTFPADRFAALAGLQLGIGSIGTLLATAPLAFSAAAIGWRATFIAVALVVGPITALIAFTVKEPPAAGGGRDTFAESLRGLRDALATPSVGLLFLMSLTSYSGFVLIVGLWGGPYLTHIYGFSLTERGNLLLLPAVTQVIGLIVWGSADRLFGSYKTPILLGAGGTFAIYVTLVVGGVLPTQWMAVLLTLLGFLSAYIPVVIAHGKSLFPPHLVGRGLTIINMGAMGGAFLAQIVSGAVIDLFPSRDGNYPIDAYRAVFALEAALILAGCLAYLRAHDPRRGG